MIWKENPNSICDLQLSQVFDELVTFKKITNCIKMQILILDYNLQLFYPPLLTIDKNCQTIYLFKKKKGSGIHAYVIRLIRKVTLHSVFGPPFTPYLLFQWYPQSKDILISLSMKSWYSAFNAQG
jgi:hypothetical protein